jgi:hypothetical protein
LDATALDLIEDNKQIIGVTYRLKDQDEIKVGLK